jgi:UDP-glucose 4-epimerase
MNFALVTGGAGFIGGHLVEALVHRGMRVRVLDNLSTGHERNLAGVRKDIEFLKGDIRDPAECARACEGVQVVFHLAAQGSVPRSVDRPAEAHDANATGSVNVLVAARDAGVKRVVYSASSAAYGETPTLPKVESMAPAPLSPYGVSKLAAEYYCTAFSVCYGLSTVSLRYFNVFGPRQDPASQYAAAIPAFVTRMIAGEPAVIFGDGEQSRDFCYIDNVVNANIAAATAAAELRGEVLNIACGERITLNKIIALINRELGTNLTPEYRPTRAGDVRHSLADISAATRLIGYQPRVLFAEGLTRALTWYRANSATAR